LSELEISNEFIEENKNICQPRPKSSPHTKTQRRSRRNEVFKLHFEYGYSARYISKIMKINRNTINNDVSFLYSKLHDDMDKETYVDWINKQLLRLESQRVRLRKELDKDITLQESLQVEKMILELDSKITSIIIKIDASLHEKWDSSVKFINKWMEDNNYKDRFMLLDNLYRIPEKSRDKIYEILKKK
jgi:DNA-binding CsgD family transcriptional regulator